MQYSLKSHPLLYRKWNHMKTRCSNPTIWIKRPHYQGCTVDDRWKDDFQQFAHDYENMIGYGLPNRQLDKDILFNGNKIYGPDTCILVPQDINILFTSCKNVRGQYPIGVTYDKKPPHYKARLRKHGARVFIGCYHTPEEAYEAYKHAKEAHIKDMANLYQHELDPRAYAALMIYQVSEYD